MYSLKNPFIKAGFFTIIIAIIAFLIASEFDKARVENLKKDLSQMVYQIDSNRILFKMEQVLEIENKCDYYKQLNQLQKDQTYKLAIQIDQYQSANLFNQEYEDIKHNYFVNLMDLYLSSIQISKECPNYKENTLVLFYKEGDCPLCLIQDKIVQRVAKKCDIRLFAFPINSSEKFLDVFEKKFNVKKAPSMLINNKILLEEMIDEQTLQKILKENQINCKDN